MKILIISQHILPMNTPRAHRATELIKEMSNRGNDVTVFAVLGDYDYSTFKKKYKLEINNIKIKTQFSPYTSDGFKKRSFIDKVLGKLLGKLLEFPNIEFLFSIPKIVKHLKEFELLISIAPAHQINWGLAWGKKKYPNNFPKLWIADCGDPFMENDTTKYHFSYFSKFEKFFCKSCDFITVPHHDAIKGYYPEFENKIKVIPQGFSFDFPLKKIDFKKNKIITFAYAGIFLEDVRNPSSFLDYLVKTDLSFKFIIYTPYRDLINKYSYLLKDKLEIRETISRDNLLKVLKKMDFLVNFENLENPTCIPSKIIDYSLTQRPILSIKTNKLNPHVINEFLNGNYENKMMPPNLKNYHISKIVDDFIKLYRENNTNAINA